MTFRLWRCFHILFFCAGGGQEGSDERLWSLTQALCIHRAGTVFDDKWDLLDEMDEDENDESFLTIMIISTGCVLPHFQDHDHHLDLDIGHLQHWWSASYPRWSPSATCLPLWWCSLTCSLPGNFIISLLVLTFTWIFISTFTFTLVSGEQRIPWDLFVAFEPPLLIVTIQQQLPRPLLILLQLSGQHKIFMFVAPWKCWSPRSPWSLW